MNLIDTRLTRLLVLCTLLLPGVAEGHHSRSAFDLESSIAVEGIVVEVGWTNPHYYLGVREARDDGDVTWTFEGHSIPGLVRNGWKKTSMRVGERVRVVANPNREPDTPFALLDHVTRADGKTFYSFRPPAGAVAAPQPPLAPATSMAGTWRLIRSLRENLVGGFAAPSDWPLQPAARKEVAAFDLRDDPALRCEPLGLPRMLVWPYTQHWQPRDGGYDVEIEHSTEHRRIFSEAPDSPEASHSGTSVGRTLSDGSYEIVTEHFAPKHWGITRGISSGSGKRLVERYRVADGGYKLQLSYTVADPAMLTEPVTRTAEFRKVHDFEFAEEPACDVATATRHLEFE